MWSKIHKNKNKIKKNLEQERKEERSERLCRSLSAKIQELAFCLLTLKEAKGSSSVSLIQKIQQTFDRIGSHEKENEKIRHSIQSIKNEICDYKKVLRPFWEQKQRITEQKNLQIADLEKNIENLKSDCEIETILGTLNKKNEKLKKHTSRTNTLKNLRTAIQKEYQKMKEEDEDGSWKQNLPEDRLRKIMSDQKEYNLLITHMGIMDKRKNKMVYETRITKTTSQDFIKMEERIQETKEKIEIYENENRKIQREILEMKELVGEETLYSALDGVSEDLLSTDSEFVSLSSSNETTKNSKFLGKNTTELMKVTFRTKSEILYPSKKDKRKSQNVLKKINSFRSKTQFFQAPKNEKCQIKNLNKSEIVKKMKDQKAFQIDSLQTLLKIPIGVDYFREFLVTQLCQENLMFWLAVKLMKQKESTKNFILYESPFEINIQSKLRFQLEKLYNNKNFFIGMFDEAHDAVFEHMLFNSWGPFKETRQFKHLLQKIKKDPNYKHLSNSSQKMKLRYNIQTYTALNESDEYYKNLMHPILVVENLLKQLIQLLEIHYSFARGTINLKNLNTTIPFQKFARKTSQLKFINIKDQLKGERERLCFFLNVYNLLALHCFIVNGLPHDHSSWDHQRKNAKYLISGNYYSLNDIFHGILRTNISYKSSSNKCHNHFNINDERRFFSLTKIEPAIHFATIDPYRHSIVKIYQTKKLYKSMEATSKDIIIPLIEIKIDYKIILPKSLLTYEKDFRREVVILDWISKLIPINLKPQLLTNQHIKYSTKIMKNPQLFIDFRQVSIKNSYLRN
ncbi:electron carrier/ protein disulfide oxidoreductase [Anaeramoeba flamelloides]|uniref:Electron carrier/ protein disulfide oxidoreductase n=1 Tax=Anaeramoeba flamelloides TaxID=1746091 RepID=A0ABQ8X5G6_9EUKA|nr:electron carrier/ protein disulfide oxidoreductase [Anaeramoeba flamelloides]